MLTIENVEVIGWEHAIRGMRNPKNSWDKSDSTATTQAVEEGWFDLGPNDLELMITVYADITAPLYWWKEFDTYKVGTVANSCSTMHKIADKEFTLDDFSCEHLDMDGREVLEDVINVMNTARAYFNKNKAKNNWWQMIQLLPSSYNQKRTVQLNYEVLANMYKSRKNHKLDEWSVDFCGWIETLPYSELITGKDEEVEIVTDSDGNEVCRITHPDKEDVIGRYNRMVEEGSLNVEVYHNPAVLEQHNILVAVRDDHNQFTEDEKWILRNYITSTCSDGVTTVKFFSDRFKEEKDEVN